MTFLKSVGRSLSRWLARRPRLLLAIQQAWLRFGHDILDLRMASWVVRRPEWLRERSLDHLQSLEPPLSADPGTYRDIAARLIRAGQAMKTTRDAALPGSMWEGLIDALYGEFAARIDAEDSEALAEYLSTLFRSSTVNGYTYGTTFDRWPHRWHYLPIQIELSVVQLAEALGLVRAECHEQGEVAFWRQLFTEDDLIAAIEHKLGIQIEQPRHGDPHGMMFGGRFLTRETCAHIHTAWKMRSSIERVGLEGPLRIVEIGGGFGGVCHWLRVLLKGRISDYAIVDLPEGNLVQGFFHGVLTPSEVVMASEPTLPSTVLRLVPHTGINSLPFRPNIVINQDSMPEMPQSEVERYIAWAGSELDGLLFSFNQETFSHSGDTLQVHVPSIISQHQRFRRVSRETSWDRRGYVEEVYETVGPSRGHRIVNAMRFRWLYIPTIMLICFSYPVTTVFLLRIGAPLGEINQYIKAGLVALSLASLIVALPHRRVGGGVVFAMLGLFVLYGFRLLYDVLGQGILMGYQTPTYVFGYFFGLTLLPIIALVAAYEDGDLRLIHRSTVVALVIVNLTLVFHALTADGFSTEGAFAGRVEVAGDLDQTAVLNPLTFGTMGAMLAAIVFGFLTTAEKISVRDRIACGALLGLGGMNILFSASRGPAIAFILVILVTVYTLVTGVVQRRAIKVRASTWFYLGALFVALLYLVLQSDFDIFLFDRFLLTYESRSGGVQEERDFLFDIAINDFLSSPIIGSGYATSAGGASPHNILLESLMSVGLVGTVFFAIAVYHAVSGVWRLLNGKAGNRGYALALSALCLLTLALTSYSIGQSPELWIFLALMTLLGRSNDRPTLPQMQTNPL